MTKQHIWPIWAIAVLTTWLYLILTGPGFALYDTHWLYAVMMVFGSAIAGFTPEGGGAVARRFNHLGQMPGQGGVVLQDANMHAGTF
jgi:Ni,Fe-hydrogenase I cytochrome b subunit